jgi:Ala-tRNA(Pro) deacylase
MTTLDRCLELLDRAGVWYSHTGHPLAFTALEVAAAEHLSPHKLAKTVVYAGDSGYGMAVLPADCLVDKDALGGFLDDSSVRLANELELGQLFPGCDLGSMPPFGSLFHLPVIVDASVAEQEFIAFNAGTHRDVIHMTYADFAELVAPVLSKFALAALEQPA